MVVVVSGKWDCSCAASVAADRWVCIAVVGLMQESIAVESRQEKNARDLITRDAA